MDQLKEFLGVVKRQHFWIIAPILLIVGIVGWMMATKKLTEEFDRSRAEVQGYISAMQKVAGERPHPNDEYHQQMETLIEQRKANVRSAWQTKWDRQKQQLKWPEQLDPAFLQKVQNLRPIESVDFAKPENRIETYLLRRYNAFISSELPKLAERVGAKWEPQRTGTTGGFSRSRSADSRREGGEGGQPVEDQNNYLVEWNPVNQGEFEDRFDWGDTAPSTEAVLYAQEDLWVLSTLIDIIARTNGDAMTRSQAAIKRIDSIEIGKNVKPPPSPDTEGFHVIKPSPPGGDGASGDGGGGEGGGEGGGGEGGGEGGSTFGSTRNEGGGEPAAGEFGAVAAAKDTVSELVKNRYYDENYQPIADYETLMEYVTVAKRIPVRLRVEMDQRRISELLVQCANAPLTFEVRQVQLNPQITGGPGMAFGGGAMRMEGGNAFGGPGGGRTRELEDYQSLTRVVELFGIVYMFNPVAEDKLGGEGGDAGGDSGAAADDDATAALPADRRLATR